MIRRCQTYVAASVLGDFPSRDRFVLNPLTRFALAQVLSEC